MPIEHLVVVGAADADTVVVVASAWQKMQQADVD